MSNSPGWQPVRQPPPRLSWRASEHTHNYEAVIDLADGRLVVARENDDRAAWTLRRIYPPERPTPRDRSPICGPRWCRSHPDGAGRRPISSKLGAHTSPPAGGGERFRR